MFTTVSTMPLKGRLKNSYKIFDLTYIGEREKGATSSLFLLHLS